MNLIIRKKTSPFSFWGTMRRLELREAIKIKRGDWGIKILK